MQTRRFAECFAIYAAHADHSHAPEICIQAKKTLERWAQQNLALFVEPEPEPISKPLALVPPEPEPEAEPELALVVVPVVDENQGSLFGSDDLQPVLVEAEPAQMIYVHFEDLADLDAFGRLIGQPVTTQTRLIEFPLDRNHFKTWREQNGVE